MNAHWLATTVVGPSSLWVLLIAVVWLLPGMGRALATATRPGVGVKRTARQPATNLYGACIGLARGQQRPRSRTAIEDCKNTEKRQDFIPP